MYIYNMHIYMSVYLYALYFVIKSGLPQWSSQNDNQPNILRYKFSNFWNLVIPQIHETHEVNTCPTQIYATNYLPSLK